MHKAAEQIVAVKERGGAVVAVTGMDTNIRAGCQPTLIAELIRKGITDGAHQFGGSRVHEMAGTLDRVEGTRAADHPGLEDSCPPILPRSGVFETTEMTAAERAAIQAEVDGAGNLDDQIAALTGDVIIKAAGNMAWPMGLRTEVPLAREVESVGRSPAGLPSRTCQGLRRRSSR